MSEILDLPPALPEYLNTRALAAYLGYDSPSAVVSAHKWIARHGVRKYYRSQRSVLVKRADVEAALNRGCE